MAKKKKSVPDSHRKVIGSAINLEDSRWLTPVTFGLMALALLILFKDFLFSNLMLYGSDMINAGIFHRQMYIEYFQETGRILQWNPYVFGGMPYVEAFHGDIFYPLSVLKFFGSLYTMLGLNQILHIYLAGFFMYLAARQFQLRKVSSLLAAVGYMLSPFLISLVAPGHEGKIYVMALFPLTMLFADRAFKTKPFLNFTYLGLVLGIIIVSPHPQMSYFTLWAVAIFSAFRLINIVRDKKSILPAIKPAFLVTYAVVVGLCLSAIQFYPGVIYTTNFSPRADQKSGWEWATSWSMHEEEAMSLLIPEFAGVSTRGGETYYWGKNPFKDNSEAVGTTIFFLALVGFLFRRRRESWLFGGLAIFVLLYALADTTPVFRLFYWLIPKVQSMRAASMIMFIFAFSSCLLAGMGLDHIIERVNSKKTEPKSTKNFYRLLFGLPSLLLALAFFFTVNGRGMLELYCSIFFSEASMMMVQQGVSKLDVGIMNLPSIISGAWIAFLASGAVASMIWLFLKRKASAAVLFGIIIIVLLNGMRFDSRFIETYDQERHFAPNSLSDFFTSRPGHYRVLSFEKPNDALLPYHKVEVVVGYHGNQLRWYDELIGGLSLSNVRPPNPRAMNLIGMKYMTMVADRQIPPDYFGPIPISVPISSRQTQIIQNDNAFPRVYLVDSFRVFDEHKEIYPAITKGSENLRQLVYLEKAPTLTYQPQIETTDSTWIEAYEPDAVEIGVSCASNKILVLTDNFYDAWHVTIDDAPAEILRAYGTFRAVEIPAGSQKVSFWFESERYALGKWVTQLTTLFLFGVIGFNFVLFIIRRRKESM